VMPQISLGSYDFHTHKAYQHIASLSNLVLNIRLSCTIDISEKKVGHSG
jgi:hypothetical protein